MQKTILDITMSLDGFIAGTNVSEELPLGKNGPRLHDWLFDAKTDRDAEIIKEVVSMTGAVIVGGHTYLTAINGAWGGATPFEVPAFVLVESVPDDPKDGFTFVTDGVESALAQARLAGGDKNVWVMGGANIAQQYIKTGLLDELHIRIAPLLLCEGIRLFEHIGSQLVELRHISAEQTPSATHLKYQVVK